jgi:hypothetical protein
MHYIITSPLIEFEGHWWAINTQGSGIYAHTMRAILGQLFAMLSHHNKVIVFRFDLASPDYTDTNKNITDFLRRLSGRIKNHYGLSRFGYVWVREQEKSQEPALSLCVNARRQQNSKAKLALGAGKNLLGIYRWPMLAT